MNEKFWGDMLGVLKDISQYLDKQDATQERAKIGTPPKIAENPKPIKGGDMPSGFGPADKIAKEYVPMDEAKDRDTMDLEGKNETFLKEDEIEEDIPGEDEEIDEGAEEDVEGYEEDEDTENIEDVEEGAESEDIDELKSILKDIRSALSKQVDVNSVMKSEVKKALPNIVKGETDKILRKMGFVPTRPDVKRIDGQGLGIDSTEEAVKADTIKKSVDKQSEALKVVEDLSKKSWTELGQIREKTEGFSPFGR